MVPKLLMVTIMIVVLTACTPAESTTTPTTFSTLSPTQTSDLKLTILYDNVSGEPDLKSDWGFAALVEYGDHTLLFDTGANGSILLDDMRQLGVDPQSIEAVIFSHEHTDHTGGLQALLDTGIRPTVYAPAKFGNFFKERVRNRTELVEVTDAVEVVPGVYTTHPVGTPIEEALVVETRDGAVVITGCAHPGVAEMVRQAQAVTSSKIAYLVGGFHLYQTGHGLMPPIVAEVQQLGVEKILPAHCTGDYAIDLFRTAYGENFTEGGVGRSITISAEQSECYAVCSRQVSGRCAAIAHPRQGYMPVVWDEVVWAFSRAKEDVDIERSSHVFFGESMVPAPGQIAADPPSCQSQASVVTVVVWVGDGG